jgi:tRNA pseudouridine55 synthase
MNGVLILDKPSGLTSHDVVNRVRRLIGQRSVGHLGTLDPMATGILPLVLGSFTRLAQFYTASEKTYEGSIRFGFATDTYDAEGSPTTEPRAVDLTIDALHTLAAEFRGHIQQLPPPFSAKKIHGVPAYKLARKHQVLELKPVQVEIKEFTITAVDQDHATFRARVASGTYMRSVAHEIGQRLGCGAHLSSLRRTSVAEFGLTHAHTLEGVAAASAVDSLCVHPRQLLPQIPSVTADELTAAHIRNGRPVNLPDLSRARQVKVFSSQRDLLAIATRIAGTLFHPKIVFAADACGTSAAASCS